MRRAAMLSSMALVCAACASSRVQRTPAASPGVSIGDTLYVTAQALEDCGRLLREQGLGFGDVVNANVYLTDLGRLPAFDADFREAFGAELPARTVVGVPALPGATPIQITLTASKARRRIVRLATETDAVQVGDTLYLSGQVSRSPGTDFDARVRSAMDRAGAILKAAGMDFSNVVAGVVFLADIGTYDRMNAIYRTYFTTAPGSRTTVAVAALPGGSPLEISFIAARTGPGGKVIVLPPGESAGPLFVPAVRVGDTVYLSGRAGYAAGGVGPQVDEVMNRMAQVLAAAGVDFSHVVEAKVYLSDMTDFADMSSRLRNYFSGQAPVLTCVGVTDLVKGSRVEITLVARDRQPG